MSRSCLNRALCLLALLTTCVVAIDARALGQGMSEVKRRWTSVHGLPQDHVRALHLCKNGYLWIGTQGGLARFDGVRFERFGLETHENAPSNRIHCLASEANGRIWVGAQENRLASLWNGRFELVDLPENLGRLTDLVVDGEGTLWVLGSRRLARVSGARATVDERLPRGTWTDADLDERGRLVICGRDGVRVESAGAFEALDLPAGLVAPVAMFRSPETRHTLLLGRTSIARLRRGVVDLVLREHGLPIPTAQDSAMRHNTRILVDRGGLILRYASGFACYRYEASEESKLVRDRAREAQIRSITKRLHRTLLDPSGTLWIATLGDGLVSLRRQAIARVPGTRAWPRVRHLASAAGQIWSSWDHGLYRWRNLRPERVAVRGPSGEKAAVELGGAAADGRLGLLSREPHALGIFRDGSEPRWVSLPTSGRGAIFGPGTQVWTGLRGSQVAVWDGEKLETWQPAPELGAMHAQCWDPHTGLWFSARARIVRVDPTRRSGGDVYDLPPSARRAQIRVLRPGLPGSIWLSTYGAGLLRLRDGRMRKLGFEQGLLDCSLGGFVIHDGRVWINSNSGVQVAKLRDLEAVADGKLDRAPVQLLETGETDYHSAVVDGAQRIWFPCIDGVSLVFPLEYRDTTRLVTPRIETVAADHRARVVAWSRTTAALDFPAGTRNLEIRYTGLCFNAPAATTFRYRLLGYDDAWQSAGTRRKAFFTRVPAGSYVFEVQAANSAGIWNPEGDTIELRIEARFYEQRWFQICLGLALAAGLAAFVLVRARRQRERLMQLARELRARSRAERAERERNELADSLKETRRFELVGRLAGGIAHDFNNMLTAILGSAGILAQSRDELPREVTEEAANIEHCALRAADLTRQILAFAREQVMHPRVVSADDLVRGLLPIFERLLPESIRLEFSPHTRRRRIRVDPSQIEQVIMNLVLNARDAMPTGGRISIETTARTLSADEARALGVDAESEGVVLRVRDDGCGIDAEVLPRIFDPFFTTKVATQGTGMGLASVHGIVSQSGGEIRVTSEVGRGSTFELVLPVCSTAPVPAPREEAQPGFVGELKLEGSIVICEDYDLVLDLIRTTLRTMGLDVHTASHPREALELAQELPSVAILITDLGLPEMTGAELATRFREHHPSVEVLYVSGYAHSVVANGEIRDENFLPKPFTPQQMIRKLAHLAAS